MSYDGIRLMYGPAMRVPLPKPREIEKVLRDYAASETQAAIGDIKRRLDEIEDELRASRKRDRRRKRRRP